MATYFKNTEFVNALHAIEELPTLYNNSFPYNCGYYNGSKWSFDCVCLIKCALSGWVKSDKKGSYMSPAKFICGDIGCSEMLSKCVTKGKDFSKIPVYGTLLYLSGHVGIYTGEFERGGKTYNAIECTTSYGAKKVTASWFDLDGTRRPYKGGSATTKKWTDWGVMPWLDYGNYNPKKDVDSDQTKFVKNVMVTVGASSAKDALAKSPTLSVNTNRKHAVVKHVQLYLNALGYNCGTADGDYGPKTKAAVVAYQAKVVSPNQKSYQDGIISARGKTWTKLLGL